MVIMVKTSHNIMPYEMADAAQYQVSPAVPDEHACSILPHLWAWQAAATAWTRKTAVG